MGPISEERLSKVHPILANLIHQLEQKLVAKWTTDELGVTQGLRTAEEQAALYAQGRQTLDEVNALRATVGWAPITEEENVEVTKAQPGYSQHEFGLAVDVVPMDVDTDAVDWNENHPVWKDIVAEGEALGMTSGISWRDEPHLQWTCQYPVTPDDEMRQLLAQGGVQAVWNSLEIPQGDGNETRAGN